MTDLIERLQAAHVGSRELDAEIALELGWTFEKRGTDRKAWWRKPGEEKAYMRASNTFDSARPSMSWTTSIDAALTMLLPGWEWSLASETNGPYEAYVYNKATGVFYLIEAATPALALCITILKSHKEVDDA